MLACAWGAKSNLGPHHRPDANEAKDDPTRRAPTKTLKHAPDTTRCLEVGGDKAQLPLPSGTRFLVDCSWGLHHP